MGRAPRSASLEAYIDFLVSVLKIDQVIRRYKEVLKDGLPPIRPIKPLPDSAVVTL
jgi:hypothetical protein